MCSNTLFVASVSQRKVKNDSNNNQTQGQVRHLVGSQPDLSATLLRRHHDEPEKKGIIKRTKSFWKFGRHSEEILEGMAMWRHRDLVDIMKQAAENSPPVESAARPPETNRGRDRNYERPASSDRSNDSDKTLKERQNDEIYGDAPAPVARSTESPERRSGSLKKKELAPLSLPPAPRRPSKRPQPSDDQFCEDDGDGLMRTVNRKSILQQYKDETLSSGTGAESDASDDITSDDPYDCIVVDDHTTQQLQARRQHRNRREPDQRTYRSPNVAEIGKKLEKLSKSNSRRAYKKENSEELKRDEYRTSVNNKINKLTAYNNEKNLELNGRAPSPAQRRSFQTFGVGGDRPVEERQFLPRTKLLKANSTMQTVMKFEHEIGLIGYEEALRAGIKRADYEDIGSDMHPPGNVYGPWYDLWGLDATVAK